MGPITLSFHQGYRDPGASNAGGAQGKGKRPQMLAAARKFSPKLKKTHFFPFRGGKTSEGVCLFWHRFQVSILGDLQKSVGEGPEQPDLVLGLPCYDSW